MSNFVFTSQHLPDVFAIPFCGCNLLDYSQHISYYNELFYSIVISEYICRIHNTIPETECDRNQEVTEGPLEVGSRPASAAGKLVHEGTQCLATPRQYQCRLRIARFSFGDLVGEELQVKNDETKQESVESHTEPDPEQRIYSLPGRGGVDIVDVRDIRYRWSCRKRNSGEWIQRRAPANSPVSFMVAVPGALTRGSKGNVV